MVPSPKALSGMINWEAHLYSGFDMSKDVKEMYLPGDLDDTVGKRIKAFAMNNGIACKDVGAKPDGMDVIKEFPDPKKIELPALAPDPSTTN